MKKIWSCKAIAQRRREVAMEAIDQYTFEARFAHENGAAKPKKPKGGGS